MAWCMQSLLAPLLCLALAAASRTAHAARAAPTAAAPDASTQAAPGRRLAQTAEDCANSVPHCMQCRYQFYGGTATKAVCSRCEVGYVVKASGRGCWCAPGYHLAPDNTTCLPCGAGHWCGGAKATAESAVRTPCGANKATSSELAVSARECLVLPGYGWAPGDASICPRGFFNPGDNARRCNKCAGALITLREGAESPAECTAPEGYYFSRGRALACAAGTYKASIGNADCDACPEGFTTPEGVVAAIAREQCDQVLAGHSAPPGAVLGATPAALCPADTYAPGPTPYDAAAGVACTPCPANMKTDGGGGETSPDACLAPPGYGFDPASGAARICAAGTFSAGWGREPCAACGGGAVTTDGEGATDEDECMTPAGHRAYFLESGAPDLFAEPCPVGTFGRDAPTTGLVAVDCTHCMEGTTTRGAGATASSACVTLPGHGWHDGGAEPCAPGYWSAGGGHDECKYCGDLYTTTDPAAPSVEVSGATGPEFCAVVAGHQVDARWGGLGACEQGWYKAAPGNASCARCPAGTTTTAARGAAALAECDACRPGFGAAAGLDAAAPACGVCPSGTYSPGMVSGGSPCLPCPKPAGFAGAMVSRKGSVTPEACIPEFLTDGEDNHESWDVIPMSSSALSRNLEDTMQACQLSCRDKPGCQYFEFHADGAPGARCFMRDRVALSKVNPDDASKEYVFFEVLGNHYVAYPAHPSDAASLGDVISSHATRLAAEAACLGRERCVGYKSVRADAAAPWKTFAARLKEGAVGKVRASGAALAPWLPEPSPDR
ncbi:MAG: hypothetical protein J3K34DRAFT_493826 [Monoraphidium minutum]|nr:MAG: hypothetical protein J3K34DRAFT_493826 [Monoraphidium minutum]